MYKNPIPTIDVVITGDNTIILVRRANEPGKGKWALPGGFINYGEDPRKAAVREAREETNLDIIIADEKPWLYSDVNDPRGHLVKLVFLAKTNNMSDVKGGDDADDARIFQRNKLPENMYAEHRKMIEDILGW